MHDHWGLTASSCCDSLDKSGPWGTQVFDDMQARGVEADVVTCCSLISALERGGQWQLAEVMPASRQAEGADDVHKTLQSE